MGRIFLRSFAMRNTLINIAAWTAAVCVVLWQRFLWPGLQRFLPGIDELIRTVASDVRTSAVQTEPTPAPVVVEFEPLPEIETFVIQRSEPKPAPRRRTTQAKPATRTRKPKPATATGFAS